MAIKILIVDDEPDLELLVRQRFRKQIREREFEFFFAHDGSEALDKLHADPDIRLMLTDINMPVMDGLTLLSRLVDVNNRLLQPVIVSAYDDMTNIRTAMNRGAFDFLTKPIDFNDLNVTIAKTLQQVRLLEQAAQTREHLAALQRELTIASSIQKSILPQEFPAFPGRTEVDLHAMMVPARNVGGDLYDFFFIDADRLAVVIGDVSGKGVPAALFMVMCRTLLKAVAAHGPPPGVCLEEVNTLLCRENKAELFVSLFYGILHVKTGHLEYSNAGHNPPLVLRNGAVHVVEGTNDTLLGLMEGLPYHTGQTTLQPADTLVLFTDGVTEAMDPQGKLFTDERLEAVLGPLSGVSAAAVIRAMAEAVEQFAAAAPQADDLTALVVRRTVPATPGTTA